MNQSRLASMPPQAIMFTRVITLLALLLSHVAPVGAAQRPTTAQWPGTSTQASPQNGQQMGQRQAAVSGDIAATKTDALLVDRDGDGRADAGDTLRYTVAVTNTGSTDASNVNITDIIDSNTVLVPGSERISPLAFAESYNVERNTALSIAAPGLLANDTGTTPLALIAGTQSTTAGGSVVVNADGSFTYTPPTNYIGPDSFTYTTTNSSGTDAAVVTLSVRAAPVATDDSYQITKNTPRTIEAPGVLANDTGFPNPTVMTFSGATTQNGNITLNADGSFSYTPPTDYTGTDSFTYTITNAAGSNTATVTLRVGDQPGAADDSYTVAMQTTLNQNNEGGLVANDAQGDPVATLSSFGGGDVGGSVTTHAANSTAAFGTNGSLTVNTDGSFSFTPANNFTGLFTFQYRLTNSYGTSDGTVTITVQQAPIAVADPDYVATTGQQLSIADGANDLLANDTLGFPAASVITFGGGSLGGVVTDHRAGTPLSFGTSGSLRVNTDGGFAFTADADFTGNFTFQYQIDNGVGTSSVTATIFVQQAPAAVDDTYTTPSNTPLDLTATGGLLANDTGVPAPRIAHFGGGSLGGTITSYTAGSTASFGTKGSLQVNADGSFTYTAPTDFGGNFSFHYRIGNVVGTSDAIVTIAVSKAPTATADSFTIAPNGTINDESLVTNDDQGVPTGTVTHFGGGSLGGTVTTYTTPGTQVVANLGTLTVNADGTFDFTPASAFQGVFTFEYRLANSEGVSDALVTIYVDRVPEAANDSYTTGLNTTLTKTAAEGLLINDAAGYPAGQIASFGGGSLPGDATTYTAGGTVVIGNGSLVVRPDGRFSFTPDTNVSGDFTFTYRLSNERGFSDATVTITVEKTPAAVSDPNYTTTLTTTLTVGAETGLLTNDDRGFPLAPVASFGGGSLGGTVTDHSAGSLVQPVSGQGGALKVDADGSFTFTAPTGFTGLFTFSYRLANQVNVSDATVTIEVRQPPTANADGIYNVNVNTTITIAANGLLANDTLGVPAATITSFGLTDAASITAGDSTMLAGGTLTVNANGSFSLVNPTVSGDHTFKYRIANIVGTSDATVKIMVRQPPTASDDGIYNVNVNTTLDVAASGLLTNDELGYPQAILASFGLTNAGDTPSDGSIAVAGGILTVNRDGSFSLANPTIPGEYTFRYRISNLGGTPTAGGTSEATVSIQVRQPPSAVDDTVANTSSPGQKYHTAMNTPLLVEDGPDDLLFNDVIGYPAATFVSFGELELAKADGSGYETAIGAVTTNKGGSEATFGAGGSLTVNTDGSFSFTPPTNYTGLFRYKYRIENAAGSSDGVVTLAVGVRPAAVNDTYSTSLVGNVGINTATGTPFSLLTNDTGDRLVATLGTPNNGQAILNSNGTFSFNPTPGYEGNAGFTYSISNGFGAVSGTLNLSVAGMIWFVDNQTTTNGDGRLGTPFNTLNAIASMNNGTGNNPAAGDTIFLYASATNYTGGIQLLNNQKLIGQGATASLLSITGLTLPAHSPAFPTTGTTNPVLEHSGGTVVSLGANNTLRGLQIGNSNSDISGTNFGTVIIRDASLLGTGQMLNLQSGTLDAVFTTLDSNSSTAQGIKLNSVDGTLTARSGSISGATTGAVYIANGNAAITLSNMSISQTNGRSAIETSNVTGGKLQLDGSSSVTVSGTGASIDGIVIDGNGTNAYTVALSSVNVNTNTMRHGVKLSDLPTTSSITITSGSITSEKSGRRTVEFASATNGTFNLSGVTLNGNESGGIVLSGLQQGTYQFGELDVNSPSGGVGVKVENNAATVSFRSIDQSGGATGILIQNTTGSFTVSGNGAIASGGIVQGLTGADDTSAGVGVWMSNARNVSLNYMRLNNFSNFGIRGTTVNGFTLNHSMVEASGTLNGDNPSLNEGSVAFNELTGTVTVQNTTIRDALEYNMQVRNSSSTLTLTVTNSTFKENSLVASTRCAASTGCGEIGLLVEMNGTASATLRVTGSTFDNHHHNHFQASANNNGQLNVTFSGNTLRGNHPNVLTQSVYIASGSGSGINVNYNIANNIMTGTRTGAAINIFKGALSGDPLNSHASFSGTISSNTIGTLNTAGSGTTVSNGIHLEALGSGSFTALVDRNQVYEFGQHGIYVEADTDGGVSGNYTQMNVTVSNNTVKRPVTTVTVTGYNGIHLNAGTMSGDNRTICFDAKGNDVTGSGKGTAFPNNADFRLRQRQSTTIRLPGYGGSNSDNAAVVSFLHGQNTAASGEASNTVGGGGGGFVGGATCTQPSAPIAATSSSTTGPTLATIPYTQPIDGQIVRVPSRSLERMLGAITSGPRTMRTNRTFKPEVTSSAEPVTANIGTLPAGKRVVLTFDVTIADPLPEGVSLIVNQAIITGSDFADVLTDDPALPGAADPTVTPFNTPHNVYLPMVWGMPTQPDIEVTSLSLSPNNGTFNGGEPVVVSAVITNRGTAPSQPFWVDLYINPAQTPELNLTWNDNCSLQPCFGLAWAVKRPLVPNESITLTSEVGSFEEGHSNWPGWLALGTTEVVILADSYNPNSIVGASGDGVTSNNMARIGGLRVTGQNPAFVNSQNTDTMSARPTQIK